MALNVKDQFHAYMEAHPEATNQDRYVLPYETSWEALEWFLLETPGITYEDIQVLYDEALANL